MTENQYPTENFQDHGTTGRRVAVVTLSILLLILLAVLGGVYMYYKMTTEQNNFAPTEDDFQSLIKEGGQLLESGNSAEAAVYFEGLLENAQTPAQEGQIKLNLGVARLSTNPSEAVALLKEVSTNELYNVFTRAKAANYILNQYYATKDNEFARVHIFTGPIWGEFLTAGADSEIAIRNAALEALDHFGQMSETPEADMRIAAEYAFKIAPDGSSEERNANDERAMEHIARGDATIQLMMSSGRLEYGDVHPSEIATAHNRKGMALGVLYFEGYIDDSQRVEEAYQDALDILLSQGGGVGTELFVRYNYADFLVRLDQEGREESIRKILTPMDQMTTSNNIATYLTDRIQDEARNENPNLNAHGRPDNIVRMAEISPEFRDALLRIGVAEENLVIEG